MAAVNQFTGPKVFAVQLQAAQMDLLAKCGG